MRVDRRREPDTDVRRPRGVGIDCGIHPDNLAADVQERPAGIPRIDRRVGLQHVLPPAVDAAEWPAERRDDPHRHGVAQIERIPDGYDPVTRLHLLRVPELGFLQRRPGISVSWISALSVSVSRPTTFAA